MNRKVEERIEYLKSMGVEPRILYTQGGRVVADAGIVSGKWIFGWNDADVDKDSLILAIMQDFQCYMNGECNFDTLCVVPIRRGMVDALAGILEPKRV